MAKMPKKIPTKLWEFWKNVDKNGPIVRPELGPCFLWKGQQDGHGYGTFYYQGKRLPAHRVACQMKHGYFGDLHVLHACDTPLCVNPDHLTPGTNFENVQDRVSRKRGGTQFTADDVLAIRRRHAAGESVYTIAKSYPGASAMAIENIVKGRTWKHLLTGGENGIPSSEGDKTEPLQDGDTPDSRVVGGEE